MKHVEETDARHIESIIIRNLRQMLNIVII